MHFILSHSFCVSCLSHHRFNPNNNIYPVVIFMKPLIVHFYQPPFPSSLLGPNILLIIYSQSPPPEKIQFHTHTEKIQNHNRVYLSFTLLDSLRDGKGLWTALLEFSQLFVAIFVSWCCCQIYELWHIFKTCNLFGHFFFLVYLIVISLHMHWQTSRHILLYPKLLWSETRTSD
jgi:hypothetical protein